MSRGNRAAGAKAHQRTLTLATVGELAGRTAEAIVNAALKAAIRDTEDRGADKKPRKVTIEIELRKFGEDNITAGVKAKTTLPPYATDSTLGEIRIGDNGQPEMSFSPASADNPDQPELPMD